MRVRVRTGMCVFACMRAVRAVCVCVCARLRVLVFFLFGLKLIQSRLPCSKQTSPRTSPFGPYGGLCWQFLKKAGLPATSSHIPVMLLQIIKS